MTPAGVLDLGRAPESAAGPDLRQLLIGSEGVFGIITRVRVRVHPVPEATRYEAWSFPDFATGADALRAVVQTGTGPTVIRLSDEAETGVNLATTESIGEQQVTGGCLAITVFEGTEAHVESRHAETRALLQARGGTSLGEAPARAWEHGRFDAPYLRDSLLSAGALCETLETATNWSNVPALKAAVTEALTSSLAESGTPALVLCHISHVYPTGASLYFTVVAGQRGNPIEQWRKAKTAASDAMMRTGATITHHHAVGADHRPWMRDEVGDLGVAGAAGRQGHARPGRNPQPGQADSVTDDRRDRSRHDADQPRVGARQRAARGRAGDRTVAPARRRRLRNRRHRRRARAQASSTAPSSAAPTRWSSSAATASSRLRCRSLALGNIPLGIIPAGTGNDHAREFRIPTKDPEAAADVVVDGWTETVDLGRIDGRPDGTDSGSAP